MADGNRIKPVNRLVLHHSAGPDFKDVDHDVIAKWFSDIGKSRGYAGTPHSDHFYTPKTGKRYETFTQAQMAGHWHNGKYCLFDLMEDKWNNVAWHAGNWAVNQRSIGIENCGNYVNKTFTTAQRIAVADFWRPQDQKLKGATYINGHKDFSATACPGRIHEAIDTIVSYINNPPAPPTPVDPCASVKAELAEAKKVITTQNTTINDYKDTNTVLNNERNRLQKELDTANAELEKCKNQEIPPTSEPCEVVKSLSWTDIFKCKWNIRRKK